MEDPRYHKNQFFRPRDKAEDEASCNGETYKGIPSYDLPNYCECGASFNSHYNGHCPK